MAQDSSASPQEEETKPYPGADKQKQAALFAEMGKQSTPEAKPTSEQHHQEIHAENIEDRRQRRTQRERLENRVFLLLAFQVIFLVILIIAQGFKLWGFSLNEWAFGIFVNGSLIHTYLLARYIAADLYTEPKNLDK